MPQLKTTLNSLLVGLLLLIVACKNESIEKSETLATDLNSNWQTKLKAKLPILGHRNWILIVDKAFPEQNAPGIEYIYANERLLPVLKTVLQSVDQAKHIKPIIYQDKELGFITEEQATGITQFKEEAKTAFGAQPVQVMLHDSVFKKLDSEAKLFKILVIKTDELLPYTSVFLQMDCAYWNADKEQQLRKALAKAQKN